MVQGDDLKRIYSFRAAFTLVEAVIVVVLASIVLLVAFRGVIFSGRAASETSFQSDGFAAAHCAFRRIDELAQQMNKLEYPLAAHSANGAIFHDYSGERWLLCLGASRKNLLLTNSTSTKTLVLTDLSKTRLAIAEICCTNLCGQRLRLALRFCNEKEERNPKCLLSYMATFIISR